MKPAWVKTHAFLTPSAQSRNDTAERSRSGREEACAAPCCPVLTWKLSSRRGRCKSVLPFLQRPTIGQSQCVDERGFLPSISHSWPWKLCDGHYTIWNTRTSIPHLLAHGVGVLCQEDSRYLHPHPLTSRLLKWRCHLAVHHHPCYWR